MLKSTDCSAAGIFFQNMTQKLKCVIEQFVTGGSMSVSFWKLSVGQLNCTPSFSFLS